MNASKPPVADLRKARIAKQNQNLNDPGLQAALAYSGPMLNRLNNIYEPEGKAEILGAEKLSQLAYVVRYSVQWELRSTVLGRWQVNLHPDLSLESIEAMTHG